MWYIILKYCVKYYPDLFQWDSDELWPGFWVYVHYDLDFGYMTLGQGHDIPLDLRE